MLTKVCAKCGGEPKPLTEFNKASNLKKFPDGHQTHCRACSRDYYLANKVNHYKNVAEGKRRRREDNRRWILTYFLTHPCVDCGEKDPDVLDFDHVRGTKRGNVSHMTFDVSLETLKQEVSKCDVRCASCHRKITAVRRRGVTDSTPIF